MAAGDRTKWNARYRTQGGEVSTPSPYLTSLDAILPRRGRALDVAGGAGRNAIWLASRGLDVSIVDISEIGLALAAARARLQNVASRPEDKTTQAPEHSVLEVHEHRSAAESAPAGRAVVLQTRPNAHASGVSLHTTVSDLESEPLPAGPWDVIVNINFLLRPLFPQFASELAPGGYLVFTQPTITNLQRHSRPPGKFLLRDRELPDLIRNIRKPRLEIIDYREGWSDEGRHEAKLLARRVSD